MATPFFVLKLVAEELDAFESLTVTSATLLCFNFFFFRLLLSNSHWHFFFQQNNINQLLVCTKKRHKQHWRQWNVSKHNQCRINKGNQIRRKYQYQQPKRELCFFSRGTKTNGWGRSCRRNWERRNWERRNESRRKHRRPGGRWTRKNSDSSTALGAFKRDGIGVV